ncbi:MAG: hypothetical protein JSR78_19915 [Proteobacteria bacterium]|nr:hypothetical protein [Pseudomonadota bacterium]
MFGVGAPTAFVAREDLFKEFRNIPHFWLIGFLFGLGVVIQMTLAFLDKYSTAEWFFKRVTANEAADATHSLLVERDTWFWAKCWLQQNWLSAVGDALTIAAFVVASILTLNALTPKADQQTESIRHAGRMVAQATGSKASKRVAIGSPALNVTISLRTEEYARPAACQAVFVCRSASG